MDVTTWFLFVYKCSDPNFYYLTGTAGLMASRFTGNISNVIRDSPVLNNVYQVSNFTTYPLISYGFNH